MNGESVVLVASSDDYLLEEAVAEEAASLSERLGGAPLVRLSGEMTPEKAAEELMSPSLFEPRRVLVVADARAWVDAKPAAGQSPVEAMDPEPLVMAMKRGVPEDIGMVIGVWAGGKPSGPLVKAVTQAGRVRWIPLPPAPKPWDEGITLSVEQRKVLRGVVARAGGGVPFERDAEELLLERLGFAPRLLAEEVRTLVAAAGADGRVDAALVRRLTFPAERSLEVVRGALLKREVAPIVDLLAAAEAGIPVRSWQGQPLAAASLPLVLFGQSYNLFMELLYMKRAAAVLGISKEIEPSATTSDRWYNRRFKPRGGLGERFQELIGNDPDSVFAGKKKKAPSMWRLGELAAGAGRYAEEELVRTLAAGGRIEAAIRREGGINAFVAWIVSALGSSPS